MKILLIEEEPPGTGQWERLLRQEGYEVERTQGCANGLKMLVGKRYDMILVSMPASGMDGWAFCRQLHSQKNRPPVLMLTPPDAGADDYLNLPFQSGELLSRVRTLLQREEDFSLRSIQLGDLKIDTARRLVTRAGHEVRLSRREYTLLESLAAYAGRVLTREAIQERVWMNEEATSKTVDVYIARLRKRIDAGYGTPLIQTVRGIGYALRLPMEDL